MKADDVDGSNHPFLTGSGYRYPSLIVQHVKAEHWIFCVTRYRDHDASYRDIMQLIVQPHSGSKWAWGQTASVTSIFIPLQLSHTVTNHMVLVRFNFYTLNSNHADLVGSSKIFRGCFKVDDVLNWPWTLSVFLGSCCHGKHIFNTRPSVVFYTHTHTLVSQPGCSDWTL